MTHKCLFSVDLQAGPKQGPHFQSPYLRIPSLALFWLKKPDRPLVLPSCLCSGPGHFCPGGVGVTVFLCPPFPGGERQGMVRLEPKSWQESCSCALIPLTPSCLGPPFIWIPLPLLSLSCPLFSTLRQCLSWPLSLCLPLLRLCHPASAVSSPSSPHSLPLLSAPPFSVPQPLMATLPLPLQ